MIPSLTFTKIVIIQSLEPEEFQSGRALREYVQAQIELNGLALPVEYLECSSSIDFLAQIARLASGAKADDEWPIVHVECHGDMNGGLEFENGSTLSWNDLAAALTTLNEATRFNLLSVFAACFGAYFLQHMYPENPAPCWCIVAPTETVDPAEILSGFRVFYRTLFQSMDVGRAAGELSRQKLTGGRWFGKTAELWYEEITTHYVVQHCTLRQITSRAKGLYKQLRTSGKQQSLSKIELELRRLNTKNLLQDFFDSYYMIKAIPENASRFLSARERLREKLRGMRSSGKYALASI